MNIFFVPKKLPCSILNKLSKEWQFTQLLSRLGDWGRCLGRCLWWYQWWRLGWCQHVKMYFCCSERKASQYNPRHKPWNLVLQSPSLQMSVKCLYYVLAPLSGWVNNFWNNISDNPQIYDYGAVIMKKKRITSHFHRDFQHQKRRWLLDDTSFIMLRQLQKWTLT